MRADKRVIIENQLERTNHDHLGKLITYASGHEAKTVVWIAGEVRDEHRKGIDWLNNVAKADAARFFAIEIELLRIGKSLPAPRFNVVCKPNEWGKTAPGEEGKLQQTRRQFWTRFAEYCRDHRTTLRLRTPPTTGYFDIALGRAGIHLALTFRPTKNRVGCELYIQVPDSSEVFSKLETQKRRIETELKAKLQWQAPTGELIRARIAQYRSANLDDRDSWNELIAWLKERAEAFLKTFAPRVKALKIEKEGEG